MFVIYKNVEGLKYHMLDRPIVILYHRQLNLSSDTRCEISHALRCVRLF